MPGHGRPGEIIHVQVLDFGSAAKITLFASDVEKVQDGLFQQPARQPVRTIIVRIDRCLSAVDLRELERVQLVVE